MKKGKYYDIITQEGANEATILLYGTIGESYEYDPEDGWKDNGIKDIDFVQELAELATKYPRIHVRINSPGGEVFHGAAIVSAIRRCPAEVNTWIDGVAASMAGVIWLSGHKRHMAKNGMLMLHSASGLCWGNAQDMREIAESLDQFDKSLLISVADSTGADQDAIKTKYFDYKDHWLTYDDVNAEGWLSEPDDYQAAAKLPGNMQNMTYRDLCQFFQDKDKNDRPGLLDKLRAAWQNALQAIGGPAAEGDNPSPAPEEPTLSPLQIQDMNLEQFKQSIEAGELSLDDVRAHLTALEPTPAPAPTPEPAPAPPADDISPVMAAMQAQLEKMQAQIAAFGAAPGAGKSAPEPPAMPLPTADGQPTAQAALDTKNAALAAAAARNEPISFVHGAPAPPVAPAA